MNRPLTGIARTRYSTLLQLLRTSEVVWNASRLLFARWDLSPSQFNVLNVLYQRLEGTTQIELSRELITHRSNITGLVERLERRGLLRREPVPENLRAYNVQLTEAGRRLIREILPEYYQRAQQALKALNGEQLCGLQDHLRTIESAAAQISDELQNA